MKYFLIILFLLTLQLPEGLTDLNLRRINQGAVQQAHEVHTTADIDILKSLAAYDYNQAQEHAGRLFIRGVIIHE